MREPSDAHETETVAPGGAAPGAPEFSSQRLSPGSVVGSRYEILGELGSSRSRCCAGSG